MSSRFINIIRKSDIINDISYNYDLNLLIDYLLGKLNSNPPPYKQTEDSEYKCILRKYENVIKNTRFATDLNSMIYYKLNYHFEEPPFDLDDEQILHDTLCLNNVSIVNAINGKYLFNNEINYNSKRRYGLNNGIYTLTNISDDHYLGILNYDISNNISYIGDSDKMKSRQVEYPDKSVHRHNFYYGNITITVSGNFHKASIYCYTHGYMGGENLFRYDETCNIDTGPILTYSMKIGIKENSKYPINILVPVGEKLTGLLITFNQDINYDNTNALWLNNNINSLVVSNKSIALAVTESNSLTGTGEYITIGYLNNLVVMNKRKDILTTNNPACTMDIYSNNIFNTYHTNNVDNFFGTVNTDYGMKIGIKNNNLYPIQIIIPVGIKLTGLLITFNENIDYNINENTWLNNNNVIVSSKSLALAVTETNGLIGTDQLLTIGYLNKFSAINTNNQILNTGNPSCTLDAYDINSNKIQTYSIVNTPGFFI
tara:strand:+ start:975 stop:2432 length:1458 start_codon:yes stop_codon:yes gene_type:complete